MQTFWKILAIIGLVVLLGYCLLSPLWAARPEDVRVPAPTPVAPDAPPPTAEPTPIPEATATPEPTPTPTATPEPTATPTPEPTPIVYTISMVGDCTLASYPEIRARADSFESVVGTNWSYPFANTRELFTADELTIVNLECSFSDQTAYAGTTFSFLAPTAATEILTSGGVEFATTANNHAMDFGQSVYNDTCAALDTAGIRHCGDGEGVLYETTNGLKVGILAIHNGHYPTAESVSAGVRALKDSGAEVVIVSAHWGDEASYYLNANQKDVGHAAIDAGASVVFGHGPHRVEPYEEYNGGVIYYSLGNFVFGGNTMPADMDCVIAQVTFVRALDGTLSLTEAKALPASISSTSPENDYCPTLFESGTADYSRCFSKVDGSWTGANTEIDYSFMHQNEG